MTYEEFCTKKEIVTNNFRKDKWRTESGSFTYPRGKKTLDTLKDIIDIVFEEDELKIEKEMTLKGEGVVGTVLLASIHITKNEKKLLRYITFIITDHLFAINSIEKTTGVLLANILYGGVMENTYIDTEDTSIINEPDIISTEDDVFHDSESVESEAGIGVKTQKKLLEHFGHPSTIYNAPESEIKGILTTGQCKEVIASKNQKKIEASIRKLEKREIYFFHRESQEYPERLAQLYEPPNLLYYIGRLPNFSKPILAIVGARRATIYGRKMAREFAKRLAECGIQIVSGMAAGVDAAGHKGALDANGYTLGVLGGGIDTIYPVENFNLYQQVYQMGGVLSEYNMGISPQKGLFPMRNRIISGLSDGIFVTEAGARSGSLITADQGLEQGKDIFALPGRITDCMSRGCNDLISQGAVLVRSPEDIMDIIIKEGKTGNKKKNMDVNREKFFKEQKFFCENKKEEKVYSLLDEIHPMTFENLLENSGFSAFELQHILMKFELKNIIYQIEQNVYLRKV